MLKKKEEEKKEKIPHMCESIGHRPLWGRCPKKGETIQLFSRLAHLLDYDVRVSGWRFFFILSRSPLIIRKVIAPQKAWAPHCAI